MQEIALILSSLAGVATAAAVRRAPRNKNQLLSLGASSHIKSQVNALKIEKEILAKTITRLYQADSEFSKIQKDKLLLKYQHQLGIVLAKLEKMEQASKHPDLGPVGDGLITLMDQKLSKLDDRLYELSSRMATANVKAESEEPQAKKQKKTRPAANAFHFEKPEKKRIEPVEIPATESRQSFEITTLTNISKTEPKFPSFEKKVAKPSPPPKTVQTELVKPREQIIEEAAQQKQTVEDKIEIIQSVVPSAEPEMETTPDIIKEVTKITEHKALPEPVETPAVPDDDFVENDDGLDKIKDRMEKLLSRLDQAEVE